MIPALCLWSCDHGSLGCWMCLNPVSQKFGQLYLCGIWLGVDLRLGTKQMCWEKIGLHLQNILTTLGSIDNMIGEDLYEHGNLQSEISKRRGKLVVMGTVCIWLSFATSYMFGIKVAFEVLTKLLVENDFSYLAPHVHGILYVSLR